MKLQPIGAQGVTRNRSRFQVGPGSVPSPPVHRQGLVVSHHIFQSSLRVDLNALKSTLQVCRCRQITQIKDLFSSHTFMVRTRDVKN